MVAVYDSVHEWVIYLWIYLAYAGGISLENTFIDSNLPMVKFYPYFIVYTLLLAILLFMQLRIELPCIWPSKWIIHVYIYLIYQHMHKYHCTMCVSWKVSKEQMYILYPRAFPDHTIIRFNPHQNRLKSFAHLVLPWWHFLLHVGLVTRTIPVIWLDNYIIKLECSVTRNRKCIPRSP